MKLIVAQGEAHGYATAGGQALLPEVVASAGVPVPLGAGQSGGGINSQPRPASPFHPPPRGWA